MSQAVVSGSIFGLLLFRTILFENKKPYQMTKKITSFGICMLVTLNFAFAQQFSGSSGTTGTISRSGNIVINNEGSGLIVDEGGQERTGFMKYPTRPAGIWRTSSAWFEIGRITSGTVASPSTLVTDIYITELGRVGIGTSNPGTFRLAVEGKIGAREIRVTLDNPWPDYVFTPQHQLRSLPSVEEFIKKHGHLPNMPSAKEVKENGIELGDMSSKLLEKIEELTLYIIELKKDNDKIREELKSMKSN